MGKYSNHLIYGRDETEHIVSLESRGDTVTIFKEYPDRVEKEEYNNWFWLLSPYNYGNPTAKKLEGNLYYKWMHQFEDENKFKEFRQNLYKLKKDMYCCYDPKEAVLMTEGITYYKGMNLDDISILSFDIETNGLKHKNDSTVITISNAFRRNGKVIKKLFSYDDYETDKDMLEAWCLWVQEQNPSIICGHNIFSFDLPYLQHCAKLNGTKLLLGRDGSEIEFNKKSSLFRKDGSQSYDYFNSHIFGREIIDTMFLSYKYDLKREFESYGLKQIIKQLGLEKKDRVFYDAAKIRDTYLIPEEMIKIKQYCEDDALDALALFDFMAPIFFYQAASIPKSFQQIVNSASGSQLNSMMIRAYLQEGHSIPQPSEVERFEGAISFGIPGMYKNCFKIDFSSQYPSIILQYEVHDPQKDPKRILLELTKIFTTMRLEYKRMGIETGNKYHKDMEQTMKAFINSLYGMLGCPGLHFNSPLNASFITEKGRELINKALVWASGKDVEYWRSKCAGGNDE